MEDQFVDNCAICNIMQVTNDANIIYETDYWQVTLAEDQYYLGRVYVTAKQHKTSLSSLSPEAQSNFWEVVRIFEAAAIYGLNARHVTWVALMNNAYRDEKPTPHVHWHVRPRYSQKVIIGGIEFVDREFGEHHQRDQVLKVDAPIMNEIARRLKDQISCLT